MKNGDKAPDFTLYDDAKKAFHLYDQLNNGPVVLLFFPAAFTGTCTTELNEVNNDLEAYTKATVVGISTDTPFTLAEYSKVNGLNFPLLSDHDALTSSAYSTRYDLGFTGMGYTRIAKRSAFVVDSNRTIRYAEVLENAGHIPDLNAIKNLLSTL